MIDSGDTRRRRLSRFRAAVMPAFVLLLLFTLAISAASDLPTLAYLTGGVLAALSVGVLANFRPYEQSASAPPNRLRRLPKPTQKVFGEQNIFAWQQAIFLLYKDNHEYIRHHEGQSSTVATLIVTVAAGAIAGALLDG